MQRVLVQTITTQQFQHRWSQTYADSVGGGSITVQDEGSALSTGATTLNFVGDWCYCSGSGATKTITVGSGTYLLLQH